MSLVCRGINALAKGWKVNTKQRISFTFDAILFFSLDESLGFMNLGLNQLLTTIRYLVVKVCTANAGYGMYRSLRHLQVVFFKMHFWRTGQRVLNFCGSE